MENLKDRAGIYKIENVKNNKVYIGSAVNLHKRKCEHFLHLKNNYHVNNYLQSSFNKYGINCFKFIVIEFIDKIGLISNQYYPQYQFFFLIFYRQYLK